MFLYGMKMMSESLQRVAGSKMRSVLSAMTKNRFLGVLTGFFVTTVIQSSSATTVMLVGFVNAGLLTLKESIGVIMGANIGTTVTGWIITIFGFKVQIADYALPLIAFGLPLIFSKSETRRSWGEFLIGFALLFLGLDFLKGAVPDIKQNPEILQFLQGYTNLGFLSTLIFLFIGTLLTIIIQSSSATMALTFVMCNQGWISFDLAAAMVLGENIGTTVTANIAAAVGNTYAKDGGTGHAEMNVASEASRTYSADFLSGCTLYTSVEPCCMCAGACYWAGIGTVVFGMTERRLAELTGDNPENLTLDLNCRSVFAAGRRPVQVRGPFAELEGEIAEGHKDFW
jgi:phosphate:Na+ symporter